MRPRESRARRKPAAPILYTRTSARYRTNISASRKPDVPILYTHGLMPPTNARLILGVVQEKPTSVWDHHANKEKWGNIRACLEIASGAQIC